MQFISGIYVSQLLRRKANCFTEHVYVILVLVWMKIHEVIFSNSFLIVYARNDALFSV